ncbi:hypothetical protein BRADI_2g61468v3 [Brachypodium distachyon]|uniref:Uncharacterized protein n=1 Tax=Brachypodium distachyon TaxID=15368 RepID=A0A0Q3REM4_BRADI|nr:hypothetical protein BRADI_2g61468v3 [Brachypodium distachyon]
MAFTEAVDLAARFLNIYVHSVLSSDSKLLMQMGGCSFLLKFQLCFVRPINFYRRHKLLYPNGRLMVDVAISFCRCLDQNLWLVCRRSY